jgi:hypothetical protein
LRLSRKVAIFSATALAVGVLTTPFAGAGTVKGTWTYTDTTPDVTVAVNTSDPTSDDATHHCSGKLPSNPAVDVNSYKFKAKRTGTLKLVSHNAADWAMEVRTAKGKTISGTDGGDPRDAENLTIKLRAGTYQVVYCNFSGEPTIDVDYSFKY